MTPEVLAREAQGEGEAAERAWAELYRQLWPFACAVARRALGAVREAPLRDEEDLAQEGLFRAWLHRRSYRPEMSYHAWLATVITNCVRTEQTRTNRRAQGGEVSPDVLAERCASDAFPDPEDAVFARLREDAVQKALAALEPRDQEILMRWADGTLPEYREAGLRVNTSTVRSWVREARMRLHAELLRRQADLLM